MPTISHPYPVLRQRLLEQGYQTHAPSTEAAEMRVRTSFWEFCTVGQPRVA